MGISQRSFLVKITEALLTIPATGFALYLYTRFKYHFSIGSRSNLVICSLIMMAENIGLMLLRFFVCLKFLLGDAVENHNFMQPLDQILGVFSPVIFLMFWYFVYELSSEKNG